MPENSKKITEEIQISPGIIKQIEKGVRTLLGLKN